MQFIEFIFELLTREKSLILGTWVGNPLAYSNRFMRDLHSWDCILLLNPTPRNCPARRHFLSYGARRYSIFPNGTFIVAVRRSYSPPFIPKAREPRNNDPLKVNSAFLNIDSDTRWSIEEIQIAIFIDAPLVRDN